MNPAIILMESCLAGEGEFLVLYVECKRQSNWIESDKLVYISARHIQPISSFKYLQMTLNLLQTVNINNDRCPQFIDAPVVVFPSRLWIIRQVNLKGSATDAFLVKLSCKSCLYMTSPFCSCVPNCRRSLWIQLQGTSNVNLRMRATFGPRWRSLPNSPAECKYPSTTINIHEMICITIGRIYQKYSNANPA